MPAKAHLTYYGDPCLFMVLSPCSFIGTELQLLVSDSSLGDRVWLLSPSTTYTVGCLSLSVQMPPSPLYPSLPTLTIYTTTTTLDTSLDILSLTPLVEYSGVPDDQYHSLEVVLPPGTYSLVYQFTVAVADIHLASITFSSGACPGTATLSG